MENHAGFIRMRERKKKPCEAGGSDFETPVLTSPDETLEAVTQHKRSASISTETQLKDTSASHCDT